MVFSLKFVQIRRSTSHLRHSNFYATLESSRFFRRSCVVLGICTLPILGWSQQSSGGNAPRKTVTPVAKPKQQDLTGKGTKTTPKSTTPKPKPSNPPKLQRVAQKTAAPKPAPVPKKTPPPSIPPVKRPNPTPSTTIPMPFVETGNFRQDMLGAVNKIRAAGCQCGNQYMPPVPPLRWNSQLEGAAIAHVRDMYTKGFMSHRGSDGNEFDFRIDREGYQWTELGENVARGQINIHQVVTDWKKSPSHCKTMMNPVFKDLGAARSGNYWVQDFGKPMR